MCCAKCAPSGRKGRHPGTETVRQSRGKVNIIEAAPGSRIGRWLRQLGPGLITGAADDDPSGIAT